MSRQLRPIHANARRFHPRQHRAEWQFHLVENRLHFGLIDEFGRKHRHQTQGHIHIGAGIWRDQFNANFGHGGLGFAFADQFLDVGHFNRLILGIA